MANSLRSLIHGRLSLFLAILLGSWHTALAADESETVVSQPNLPSAELNSMRVFWDSLDRKTGDVELPGGLVVLHVPEDYYSLGDEDSERVLVEVWGNPTTQRDY